MLSGYYIVVTLPVNYYDKPPACVSTDYTINYSSLQVLINDLAIVWPACVPLAATVRACNQLPSLCQLSLPLGQTGCEGLLDELKHQGEST